MSELKPAEMGLPQPWEKLKEYLDSQGFNLDLSQPPRQFSSGFGNLNYLVTFDNAPAVLRRPPPGPIPPGANDMKRESTILEHLWEAFPYAPRSFHFCSDTEIIGAPFFIMEYRPGIVIGGEVPGELEHWRNSDGKELGEFLGPELIKCLAELHTVQTDEIGLAHFGRSDGFIGRTLAGWKKRAELSWDNSPDVPVHMMDVISWLECNQPPDGSTALIHNDFKLDNFILNPETLETRAIIDWDMGTRGNPLYDLAVLLSYWTEAGDPPVMHKLGQMPTANYGFPTRQEVAQDYARITGCEFSDFCFFRVLATFRLAVVFRQLYRRFQQGGTQDQRFAGFGNLADGLITFSHSISQGKYS